MFMERTKNELGPEQQFELEKFSLFGHLLPTLFMFIAYLTPLGSIAMKDGWNTLGLGNILVFFSVLNVGMFLYILAERTGILGDMIPDEGNRTTLSIGLGALAFFFILGISFLL